MFQFSRRRAVRPRRPITRAPLCLESLEPRTVPDGTFTGLADKVDSQLATVEQLLKTEEGRSATVLPIANRSISGVMADVQRAIDDARRMLHTALAGLTTAPPATLQSQIYSLLSGRGLLHDVNGNGNRDDVSVVRDAAGDLVFTVNLGSKVPVTGVTFSAGLPGLPLHVRSGSVRVNAGFTYDGLTFRLGANDTPSVDQAGRVAATVDADLAPNTTIRGSIGFMEVSATPSMKKTEPTVLGIGLSATVTPTGLQNPRLDGTAEANLVLKADFTGNGVTQDYDYPYIQTTFHLHWGFNSASPGAGLSTFGDDPVVEFKDVQFGVGAFLSHVLKPVVETVQGVLKPFNPILDILSAELPGLSDLSKDAGLGPVSIESLARLASASGLLPPDYKFLIDLIVTADQLRQFVNTISTQDDSLLVPVGTFSLGGMRTARAITDIVNDLGSPNLTTLIPAAVDAATSVLDAFKKKFPAKFGDFLRPLGDKLQSLNNGAGFDFPLLGDPRSGVFKLLLGQDVDFVNFHAQFHLAASQTQLLDIWGPAKARFSGAVDADAYFKVGYDTYGLRQFLRGLIQGNPEAAKLANGLYFDSSRDLLRLSGSLSAGLALAAPMPTVTVWIPPTPLTPPVPVPVTADASVNGKINVDNFRVHFGTAADKLRLFESVPSPLFQTSGLVTAGFDFEVEAGVPGVYMQKLYTKPIAEQTLIDLNQGPLANPANEVTQPPPEPPPADITLDLTNITHNHAGFIALPDTVRIYLKNGNVNFQVNGKAFRPPMPVGRVGKIRVITDDYSTRLTVDGAIDKDVTFDGGLGLNTVTLDDSAARQLTATYTIAPGEMARTGVRATGLDKVDVHVQNAQFLGLNTCATSASSTIEVQPLFDTRLNLTLGGTDNAVMVDETTGGAGDVVQIAAAPGATRHNNALTLRDNDGFADRFTSAPATYTLAAGHSGTVVTDTRVVREKRRRVSAGLNSYQYTATATVDYSGINSVTVQGGDLGNTFNVEAIDPAVRYSLTGGAGDDVFTLGAGLGRIGFVNGTVGVNGGAGTDSLVLDGTANDRASYSPQSGYTVNGPNLAVQTQIPLGGYTVNVSGAYSYQNVEHLTVKGGGFETITVNGTAAGDTTIATGNVHDRVQVNATSDPLFIDDAPNSSNVITIGGPAVRIGGLPIGGLDRVRGAVTLRGQHPLASNQVTIDDTAARAAYTYTLDAGRLTRSTGGGPASAIVDFGGVTLNTLQVQGGGRGNAFEVNDSPVTTGYYAGTTLLTGGGSDTVNVRRTTGDLTLYLGAGSAQTLNVGDAGHSLDEVRGNLKVYDGDNLSAVVSDQASDVFHQVVIGTDRLGVQTVKRQVLNGDHYDTLNTITFGLFSRVLNQLDYQDSSAGDAVFVEGNPAGTTLNVRGAANALDEYILDAQFNAVLGPVNFLGGGPFADFGEFFDYQNNRAQTYTVTAAGPDGAAQRVDRGGLAPTVFTGVDQVVLYSTAYAYTNGQSNVVNVNSVPAGVFLNMALSGHDHVNVGSAAPNLGGSLAGIRGYVAITGQHVSVVLDDSGDADLTPKTVTFAPGQGRYSLGDTMTGLTHNPVYWNLDPDSTLAVKGGAADETFAVAGASFLPAISVDGGGGNNTLDYSAYNGLVGLVATYQADGDAQDSLAANDGLVEGNVAFGPGAAGQAFSFDGTGGDVRVIDSPALQPPTVSVEAWVNSTGVGPGSYGPNAYIVAKGAQQNVAASYALYTGEGSGLRFYVFDGTTFVESPDAGAGIWDGQWHHVVGTYDGTAVRLYVDGVEVGTGTPTTIPINYSIPHGDLYIGTYDGQSGYTFSGLIDEVSIFSRPLSAAEVQQLYAAGPAGDSALGTGVEVDLQAGTATGLRGGVSNIQNVAGSAFGDILVGGDGAGVFDGRGGRDLILAGLGPHTLLGGAGDDVLVAGTTTLGADGLRGVLADWSRTDLGYQERASAVAAFLDAHPGAFVGNGQGNALSGQEGEDLFLGSGLEVQDLQEVERVLAL